MTSSSAFDKLKRILYLEREQSYDNRAVIGGLDRFLIFWQKQARQEAGASSERVDAVMRMLSDYGSLSLEQRRSTVRRLIERLEQTSSPQETDRSSDEKDKPPAEQIRAVHPEGQTPKRESQERTPKQLRQNSSSSADDDMGSLTDSVESINGVGPKNAERLARLGVHTVRDLLYHFPRRYDDFGELKHISQLVLDEEVTVVGVIRKAESYRTRRGTPVFRITLSDGTGVIQCSWFNQPYLERSLNEGREIAVSGQVGEYLGRLVFTSPEWEPLRRELLHTKRLVPIYPLTEGLHARWLRRLIRSTLKYWVPRIVDPMPQEIVESAQLMDLRSAIMQIHFPESRQSLMKARERLCFDELFLLQLGVLHKRHEWRQEDSRSIEAAPGVIESFVNSLPYELTGAQQRAIQEILDDMARPVPMSRLLQGDVGSGKTVVAVAAILAAVRAGYQVALMAPTSILAEQHYATISELLADYSDVDHALLMGSQADSEKDAIREGLAEGRIDVVVGTHALLQESVDFERLGLVVVDEQHRFGVAQRSSLREKGNGFRPHLLAMSATPIPRTLALTIYGDLDISTLDEMPPNRRPVISAVRTRASRERIYSFMRTQIKEGRQAFVICPLVEESEAIEAKSAVKEHERLQKEIFPQFKLGLLHGRVGADEKERVMSAFKAGDYDILVSTAVVEVGIDVPNATMMLIEGAERFGLAQLHQFRGRVGRGAHKSYCVLVSDSPSPESIERLQIIEQTTDGFELAEKDLELRGPGDFFGVRQHGLPELKVARLSDRDVLLKARRQALQVHKADPELKEPEHRALAHSVEHFWASVKLA